MYYLGWEKRVQFKRKEECLRKKIVEIYIFKNPNIRENGESFVFSSDMKDYEKARFINGVIDEFPKGVHIDAAFNKEHFFKVDCLEDSDLCDFCKENEINELELKKIFDKFT